MAIRSFAFLTAMATARIAVAQPAAQTTTTSPFRITAGAEGVAVESGDGAYRLAISGVFQTDARVPVGHDHPGISTFTLRKVRPSVSGRMGRQFEFRITPDFGNGRSTLVDGYVDVLMSPRVRLRAGKDKTPIGYELLISDVNLPFPERALTSSLVPNRDIGVQVRGDLLAGRVSYAGGLFNGIPDGTNQIVDLDTNDAKDAAGRVIAQPLRGLSLHLGASQGAQSGALPTFRTSIGEAYFDYAADVRATGRRTRVAPALAYSKGPFFAFGEYVRSTQRVSHHAVTRDVSHHAWDVTTTWVVTGEASSERGVRPARARDPERGTWGAVQLVARYSALTVDDEVFSAELAAPNASGGARQATVGANWYLNANMKIYVTFERTTFVRGAGQPRPPEHVVLSRVQLAF